MRLHKTPLDAPPRPLDALDAPQLSSTPLMAFNSFQQIPLDSMRFNNTPLDVPRRPSTPLDAPHGFQLGVQ